MKTTQMWGVRSHSVVQDKSRLDTRALWCASMLHSHHDIKFPTVRGGGERNKAKQSKANFNIKLIFWIKYLPFSLITTLIKRRLKHLITSLM